MSQKNLILIVLFILLAVLLVGCVTDGQPKNTSTEMANPASVYCQGLGFQEETRQNELGEYGVCVFPDGSECDSWDFLAGRCGQEHSYCVDQGYELQVIEDSNIANCLFDDSSICSEFLYFQGECIPGEK